MKQVILPFKLEKRLSLLKGIIVFLFLIVSFIVSYGAVEVDGIFYNLDEATKTCEVTYGTNRYQGRITIPEKITYNGVDYSVTSIGDLIFNNCTDLTSITIGNSVTTIGMNAFYRCNNLTSVTLGNSITTIGQRAFLYCTSLTSIEIPNSVSEIGENAFSGCDNLSAFYGKFASEDHRCLIIDGTITSFAPAGLTSYTIPDNVTEIGNNAFSYCSGLTTVTIGNSVISIGQSAFSESRGLTSVTIGNSVTSIGKGAFSNCSSLKSVTIPNSVSSIGEYAFQRCDNLCAFYGKFAFEDHRCLIIDGTITSFAPAGLTSYIIPDNVTEIGNYAFSESRGLTSVTIPNSVTSIGTFAFYCCSNLTTVTIPNSVTSIGQSAFSGCIGLTTVTIPNSVTSIGQSAFSGCIGLTSVTMGNSVTSIGRGVFEDCIGLTTVTIPNSVTSIGIRAFLGCDNLSAFYGKFASDDHKCLIIDGSIISSAPAGLTSYIIPDNVTSVGNYAFCRCHELTSVIIPNSVTTLQMYAFSNCNRLTSVTIPNSVTEIGELSFSSCNSLTSVTIGNSLTKIGDRSFRYCINLSNVNCYAPNPPSLGTEPFEGLNVNEITLHVIKDADAAYKGADEWKDFIILADLEPQGGIEGIEADDCNVPVEYFNLSGISVDGDALTPGLYIKRQGGKTSKVIVK